MEIIHRKYHTVWSIVTTSTCGRNLYSSFIKQLWYYVSQGLVGLHAEFKTISYITCPIILLNSMLLLMVIKDLNVWSKQRIHVLYSTTSSASP